MKREWWFIPVFVVAASAAHSESWRTANTIIPEKSAGSCAAYGGDYVMDLTGGKLTVSNVNGKMFTIEIPESGAVNHPFKSPSGASLEMVGNAKSRELEIVNSRYGCRWKMTPK